MFLILLFWKINDQLFLQELGWKKLKSLLKVAKLINNCRNPVNPTPGTVSSSYTLEVICPSLHSEK